MQVDTISLTKRSNSSTDRMCLIPAGKFLMGAEGWGEFESPVHEVFVDDFLMDATSVTNQQFSEFIIQTGYQTTAELLGRASGYKNGIITDVEGLCWKAYYTEERKDHPVVLISWHDANAFANWKGKRLPTEAEWEKAARGGYSNCLYPWGNNEPNNSICNFGKETENFPATTDVMTFPPNAYGLYDMVGNVWNWCADWFGENYYSESPSQNPSGKTTGLTKIRRGASFNIIQIFRLRCSNRGAFNPDRFAINIGFRCAKDFNND